MTTLNFKRFSILFCLLVWLASCNSNYNEIGQNSFETKSDTLIVKEKGIHDSLGNKIGLWVGYLSNDTIGYIGYFKGGVKDSVWMYYDQLGKKVKEEHYINGLKNGTSRVYTDGNLYDEVEFKDNKKSGRHIHYFSSGNVNFYQEYKDGLFNGDYVLFYEDGMVKQRGRFSQGRCIGEWLLFSHDGKVIERTIYDSLSTMYREIKYDVNGEIISDERK